MGVTGEWGDGLCRRQYVDRRQPHLYSFYYAFVRSRRHVNRRDVAGQTQNFYSDRYSLNIAIAVLVMMLLCVADTMLTLLLVERGANELNPLLARLLSHGAMWFFAPKYVLTALCVFTLVVHTRFAVFGMRGYHLLLLSISCYLLLINYQVLMLIQ